jgi:hypothetical protein
LSSRLHRPDIIGIAMILKRGVKRGGAPLIIFPLLLISEEKGIKGMRSPLIELINEIAHHIIKG